MRLFVIRHATAEAPGESGDVHRRLTPLGRRQAGETGRALRERGVLLARLLSSPAARARETAEGIAGAWDPAPPVELLDGLYPGLTVQALSAELGAPGDVALVSHLPWIDHLARALLSHPAELRFPPSTVCCIEFDAALIAGEGRLAWVLTP
jgi:phosphohistidine phosphatase